ncbi:hypothetical protein [Nocardia noduli]|uniref:hypothetical protein n=1 Tax=Nocardia noduli TaxID=2815722 RepID=UPI001C22D82C|nr:hypothetical protein [Nocardia noduli]
MGLDINCPQCHRLDLVQSVPALCADGMSTSYGTNLYSGVGISTSGLVPIVGTATIERTHTTSLARAFERGPALVPTGRLTRIGVLLLLMPLLTLGPAIAAFLEPGQPRTVISFIGTMMMPALLAIPAVATLLGARSRRRLNARIARGRPHAHAVWSTAFYCHRCGLAFWPYSPVTGVPARQSVTPQQFRWLVWNAAGYHNL